MANRTAKEAKTIHGTNPQYLIEKIIRTRIYESKYWKEDCFALNMELLVDKGVEMRYVGGTYGGNIKPSPFICLVLKMLQIQPEEEIVLEFISQEDFKYLRALGAFYLRLTANSLTIWRVLEPIYADYRQLRMIDRMGKFSVITMDELIDQLLHEERVFDVILPRMSKRQVHEDNGELSVRKLLLDAELNDKGEADMSESDIEETSEPITGQTTGQSGHVDHSDHSGHRRERSERKSRRHRSRSRDRDRKHRSRSRDRYESGDTNRHRYDKPKTKQEEIEEANKLRAKLGMKPLRVNASDRDKPEVRSDDRKYERNDQTNRKSEQDEIEEANKLRAKLGLKPLRR